MSGATGLYVTDLVIDDGEFMFAESVITTYVENLTLACTEMEAALAIAGTQVIQSSQITSALEAMASNIAAVRASYLAGIAPRLQGTAKSFISSVNAADKFMY